ncbi:MAG: M24 family metallopeptidase [Candidatus Limnocylindrales bacterium]
MNTSPAETPAPSAADTPGSAGYRRFSSAEYARRRVRVEALMADTGTDVLVILGNVGARHEVQYLTAFGPRWDSYLCYPRQGSPRLYVQLFNHVPNAREMAVVDIAWAGTDPIATVAGDLLDRGLGAARIGLVGAISHRAWIALSGHLPKAELVDVSADFRRLRLVKSADEISWTREAARVCDLALAALVAEARPGLREHELGTVVEAAYGRAGGQHAICFLASGPMSGPGCYVPAQNWSNRRLRRGDVIIIELSAGFGGYTGQVLRSISVGAEPTTTYRRLHQCASNAFEAIAAEIRPGASAASLLAAAGSIDRAGYTVCDDVVHGYGGGYLPPVLRSL